MTEILLQMVLLLLMLSSLFRQIRRNKCLLGKIKDPRKPEYYEDQDQLEEKQEEETGGQEITNQVF